MLTTDARRAPFPSRPSTQASTEQSTSLQERKVPSCSGEVLSDVLERQATPTAAPPRQASSSVPEIISLPRLPQRCSRHLAADFRSHQLSIVHPSRPRTAADWNRAPLERPSRYQLKYHHH